MVKKHFLIVLLSILVLSPLPSAFANLTESVSDPPNDLLIGALNDELNSPNPQPAPTDFYADYIDITSASVTSDDVNYVHIFRTTVVGTPTPPTPVIPAFPNMPVAIAVYVWKIFDADGNVVRNIRVIYCSDRGWFAQFGLPFTILADGHTLQVTAPNSLIPATAHHWLAVSFVGVTGQPNSQAPAPGACSHGFGVLPFDLTNNSPFPNS